MISDQPKLTVPHREPFLFLSRLLERNSNGGVGVVEFDVRADLDIFRGHFPGNPVLPGAIQIEFAAQAALWIFYGVLPQGAVFPEVLFRGTDFTFRKTVKPGDVLRAHVVREVARRKNYYVHQAKLYVGSELVSEGHLRMLLVKPAIFDGVPILIDTSGDAPTKGQGV